MFLSQTILLFDIGSIPESRKIAKELDQSIHMTRLL